MSAPVIAVQLLNIDGSIIAEGTMTPGPAWEEAIRTTIGVGYTARVNLPVPPHADPRCPYMVNVEVNG